MIDMKRIRKLTDSIVREFRPERVILFGSHAYGTPGVDSDVDLLVVMPFRGNSVHKAFEIIDRVKPNFSVDLLVRKPDDVRQRVANNDWFMREVLERGRILYESDNSGMG